MLRLKNGKIHQKIKFSQTKSLKNNKKFPVVNPNSLRGYKNHCFFTRWLHPVQHTRLTNADSSLFDI